ncbi:glycosyltransferase [Mucilaginibacter dorajii]|uniref:Glycosyltransferase 2-like domain-containing protein n=1 Tax=Mucilaginibacter dorajii TaxID=692994 RepID=A0ABP7Q2B9_9SPHI|nr:glycosyltransferase [Mucilaginibacter dorajii]MCS3732770.1 glycosyltransferase involved in cell wall biosynthesis [Mucilaginibacter dorajii]
MNNFLSVIMPAYNPHQGRLAQVIEALQIQTLPTNQWELLIIDNNSPAPIQIDLSWHPHHRILIENKQGLTHARLKGFSEAKGELLLLVDDDNILEPNYLKHIVSIFESDQKLGAIGGKSLPLFEATPPTWLPEFYGNLALRDLGESILTASKTNAYPTCAPIGAGMGIRKLALANYIKKYNFGTGLIGDRTGKSLASGGDNDIVLEILAAGWRVGYFPDLTLQHIIPKQRIEIGYLARLVQNTNESWVAVLEKHSINPWQPIPKWSVPLRKLKAWLAHQAWKNSIHYLKWKASCGLFDGLSAIEKKHAKT